MRIWQAHKNLALAIGDEVSFLGSDGELATLTNVPVSIPDGARFPRALRDSHIYRAMLKIYNDIFLSMASVPKNVSDAIIEKTFINTLLEENAKMSCYFGYTDIVLNRKPMYIVSVSLRSIDPPFTFLPLPMKYGIEIGALLNARSVHRADAFCFFNFPNSLRMFDQSLTIDDLTYTVHVRYLPYPREIDVQDGTNSNYNWNEDIDIEEAFIPMMLSYAKIYALQESQDIESLTALQLELGLNKGGQ